MTTSAVSVEAASVRYDSIGALDRVSIDVAAGEKVALIGASGSGKSTLLAAIAGRVALDAGSVHVFGQDIDRLDRRSGRAVRSRIGIVSQSLDMALPLRVVHNVNAGTLGRRSGLSGVWSLVRPGPATEARDVLAQVGLADRLFARTDELSGGEQQRVAIARVLLQQPDLVLADEPTASVDPKLADDMLALLCRGPHSLVVSVHDPALALRHVARVLGLRDGSVVLDEPVAGLAASDLAGFYDR